MSQTVGLAEYACDSCRARKLKCSRERPKCTNCAMWPGPCVYSKQGPAIRQTRSKNLEAFRTHSPNSASASSPSIEARLATVEASLSRLASAVQSLTETINDKPRQAVPPHPTYDRYPDIESTNVMPPSPHKTAIQDEADTSCYVGNSPASSILIQGPKDLDQLQGISLGQGEARTVASGLRDLSQAFATMGFKDEVRRELRNRRRESDLFHVPGKSLGAQLIQKFSDIISIGDPFFSSPAPDLLPKLVFEPWNVSERGWVIIFNCLLAADIPPDDPFAEGLRLKLRWNTWLALEDSCIFLEPSTVKIQALVLVACHGEDFATPSLSWNLVGHACRMAQALGLHTLGSTTNAGKQSSDQALCLFWSLFMIDKSLSLAFGRPPFLPGLFYERVPVPGLNLLAKFKPHAPRAEREDAQENKGKDMFGAFYVLQSLKLARIMGAISDGLQAGSGAIMKGDKSDGFITGHKEDLDAWMRETFEIVPKHGDNTLRSPSERKEILLGLHFLQFQYHHLVIFLTRSHAPSKQVCIESAREALSLLKNLVSSSEQVYNGITWQLLYYPFTPFFALLGSIISDPNSGDSLSDLLLLRLTVSYFGEMDKIHPHASKLKDVTETFCQLAEAYVSRAGNNKHMNLYNGTQEDGGFGSLKNRESDAQCNANGGNKNSFPFVPVKPSPHSTLSDTQEFVALNDFPTDPAHLLDLFSVPPQDLSSINHWIPTNMPMDIELDTGDQINENFTGSEIGLIQSLHSKILDRPMEGTFDWFSWDMYNQDPLDMSDYT